MPSANTIITGGPSSPAKDATAPGTPCARDPNRIEKFTTLGPGRNWHSASASLNSLALIQARCSTMTRRAHGSTPPKPESDTLENATNSSKTLGGNEDTDVNGAASS